MDGKRKKMPMANRATVTSHGTDGKTAAVGVKDRRTNEVHAEVVASTDAGTIRGFVRGDTQPGAVFYADETVLYRVMHEFGHEAGNHDIGEHADGVAHSKGIEGSRSMLKRARGGTFHKMSPKRPQRYVSEFTGKCNIRDSGTLAQVLDSTARFVVRKLLYRRLIADNGFSNAGRP